MGNLCSSCFGERSDSSQILTPDIQDRRQQMAEAAERRIQEQERKVTKFAIFYESECQQMKYPNTL